MGAVKAMLDTLAADAPRPPPDDDPDSESSEEPIDTPDADLTAWSSGAGHTAVSSTPAVQAEAAAGARAAPWSGAKAAVLGDSGAWMPDDEDEDDGRAFSGASPHRRRAGPGAAAWLKRTRELMQTYCKPKIVTSILEGLLAADTTSVAAAVGEVTPLLDTVMAHSARHCGALRPRHLDVLGEILERHTSLRAALDADTRFIAHLDAFLAAAAAESEVYDSPFAFSHMCTAQRRLRRASAEFWDALPTRDLSGVGPRAAANALHSAAELVRVHSFAPPSADTVATLFKLAAEHADGMTVTELTLSVWALAKLHVAPAGKAAGRLRNALADAAPRFGPKQAALCMWALANLRMHFHGRLRDALTAVLIERAPRMNEQDVVNTLYAFAVLPVPVEGPLLTALLAPAERLVPYMRPSEVHDALVSLARLGAMLSPGAQEGFVEAARGAIEVLDDKRRANIVWACTNLEVDLTGKRAQRAAARARGDGAGDLALAGRHWGSFGGWPA